MMTLRAQSAFWVNLVHKIVVADCSCDDPWAQSAILGQFGP